MDKIKEVADGLQSLLDDCAFHGATLDSCTCADFEQSGACEHVDTLHTFKDFYSTNFHHIKRNGVTVNAYRVKWHEVSKRMIVIPEPEGKIDYTTTLHTCTCPDFEYRGGSYLGTDGKRICKHIHHQRKTAPAYALPVPQIA